MNDHDPINPYDEVAEMFAVSIPPEDSAQLCVFVRGEKVLLKSSGVDPSSLTHIYSCSKALSAIAFAHIVGRELIDVDARVSEYWPEFGAKGKQKVSVRQLLSHQAGLPETRLGITNKQWLTDHEATDLLAQERPLWAPGRAFGYHALAIGSLISELSFRVTGMTIQNYYEQNIRIPSGAHAFLGLNTDSPHRVSKLLRLKDPTPEQISLYGPPRNFTPGPYGAHVFRALGAVHDEYSVTSPNGVRFGQPAAGGVATAEGMATVFQWATGYGGKNPGIRPEILEDFSQLQVNGFDIVLDSPNMSFGTIFMKPSGAKPFGSLSAFGHDGAAGSLVFADPVGEIVVGYTINRFTYPGGMDNRLRPIIKAIQEIALKS